MFELRIYDVAAGRSMDMVDRMTQGLLPLFVRHGIPLAGYWVARSGGRLPRFYYLMNWSDDEERRRRWGGFYEDPDWPVLRQRTNAGSELVERGTFVFMDDIRGASLPDVRCTQAMYRLSTGSVAAGAAPRARSAILDVVEPLMLEAGGEPLALWNPLSGPGLPALVHLSAWASASDAAAFESRLDSDRGFKAWLQSDREANGAAALTAWEVSLLEAPPEGRPLGSMRPIVESPAISK
jgi:hypothetical protein